jgi:RimJ/RimL family protein N-acetyltransferase
VPDFRVRTMRRNEVESALDLIDAVVEERRWLSAEPPMPRERLRDRTLEALDDPHCLLLVAADDGDRVIGELSAFGRPNRPADIGMSVAKEWRGQGIGTSLMEECVGWARENGIHKLALWVWPHNDIAVHLYEKFGFEREGLLRSHYKRANGDVWDVIVMGLLLE